MQSQSDITCGSGMARTVSRRSGAALAAAPVCAAPRGPAPRGPAPRGMGTGGPPSCWMCSRRCSTSTTRTRSDWLQQSSLKPMPESLLLELMELALLGCGEGVAAPSPRAAPASRSST